MENQNELEQLYSKVLKTFEEPDNPERLEKEARIAEQERLTRIVRSNEIAGIPKRFSKVRFSDYPSDFTEKAKELCLNKNTDHILLLYGPPGRGKTSLMCSAIHERAYNGLMGVRYYPMRNLETDLRRFRNYQNEDDEKKFLEDLSTVSFLCIDEIGYCLDRREETYFLRRVLCQRYDNELPTWLATNLSPYKLKALFCDINVEDKSNEECKALFERLDKQDMFLNRIKSVIVTHPMVGESFREVNNDGRSNNQ